MRHVENVQEKLAAVSRAGLTKNALLLRPDRRRCDSKRRSDFFQLGASAIPTAGLLAFGETTARR